MCECQNLSEPILHNDLRPCNVLLVEKNGSLCAKIADYGIAAKRTPDLNSISFNKYCCPPEIFFKGQTTFDIVPEKIDVYSFGLLVVCVLTNWIPKTEDDMQIFYADPLSPVKYYPEWSKIVSQCCDVDPQNRPTFGQVLQRLVSVTEGLPAQEALYPPQVISSASKDTGYSM